MYSLNIKIKFFDYWHCGSGESGGNESDALVVTYDSGDNKGLPYVPAKTLKGLMREMMEVYIDDKNITCADLQKWFGNTSDTNNTCYKKDEVPNNQTETYLGNADIVDDIAKENIPLLFKNFKNTKLKNSIAEDGTLREIQTVIPLTLQATFYDIDMDSSQCDLFKKAIKSIKRIGLNRNRGMGRCEVSVVKEIKS